MTPQEKQMKARIERLDKIYRKIPTSQKMAALLVMAGFLMAIGNKASRIIKVNKRKPAKKKKGAKKK